MIWGILQRSHRTSQENGQCGSKLVYDRYVELSPILPPRSSWPWAARFVALLVVIATLAIRFWRKKSQ